MVSDATFEKVRNLAEAPIEAVFTDHTYGKVLGIPTYAANCCSLINFEESSLMFLVDTSSLTSVLDDLFVIYHIQFERGEALDLITQNVKGALAEECDEESLKVLPKVVDSVRKEVRCATRDLFKDHVAYFCITSVR